MRYLIALLAFLPFSASAQGLPGPSIMQVLCVPTDSFRSTLTEKHKESPVALGVTGSGRLLELWSSRDGDTWTVALSDGQEGLTCIIADGEGLELKPRGGL